jgi:hypothetical protein
VLAATDQPLSAINSWPEKASLVTERNLNLDAEAPEPPICTATRRTTLIR